MLNKIDTKKIFSSNITILIVVCILLSVILTILSDFFFEINNFTNIASQTTVYGILAIGATFVIMIGCKR